MKITRSGFNEIMEQANLLKTERPQIVQRLDTARNLGDLKENAEYSDALTKLNELDSRLENLMHIISNAVIIDSFEQKEYVDFGAFVTIEKDTKQETFQIVSDIEANFDLGKLSENSPFAKSLLNKKINDIITFKTPQTQKIYKIINIKYL